MGEEQAPEEETNGKDGGGLVHTSGKPEPLYKEKYGRGIKRGGRPYNGKHYLLH